MKKVFKASGSTGLADALTAALSRKPYSEAPKHGRQPVQSEVWVDEVSQIPQDVYDRVSKRPRPAGVFIDGKPDPIAERRKREEQGKRITKLCAIIKCAEPRLLMELLQTFGSIEGLSAPKQAELIQRLEGIRKEYSL